MKTTTKTVATKSSAFGAVAKARAARDAAKAAKGAAHDAMLAGKGTRFGYEAAGDRLNVCKATLLAALEAFYAEVEAAS